MDKISRIDCDVFCVDGNVDMYDICITGNFYANCGEVNCWIIEAGESINISADSVSAASILTLGSLNIQTTSLEAGTIVADEGTTIDFYSPELFIVAD